MKIRNKILIYFSSTVISLMAVSFTIIYLFFSAYREEEFQQRQKEKITTTLKFLTQIKHTDEKLIEAMDQLTINDLYQEKLLLYNSNRELIYSSVDDMPVSISKEMLAELNPDNRWIETKEGLYDVVGTYIERNGHTYFGISKAYDTFGYTKLSFLRNILLIVFAAIVIAVLLISLFIGRRIAKPISGLASLLSAYKLGDDALPKGLHTSTYEIKFLNEKFNELTTRTNEAFAFQKHSIHHISHQLKTPLAVLVSELERIKNNTTDALLQPELEKQINKTKSLADIINVLLEISKLEAGQPFNRQPVRVDEVIFDCIDELNTLYPDFHFEVNFFPAELVANRLVIDANEMLIRQVFQNLLANCIAYSTAQKAEIRIDGTAAAKVVVTIYNSGQPVSKEEEKYLFNHFFRGENSQGKIGFGLGLVLAQKIIALHSGSIVYANPSPNLNVFEVSLPLS